MFRFSLHTPDPESELLIGMSRVPKIFGPFKFARAIATVVTGISSVDIRFESRTLLDTWGKDRGTDERSGKFRLVIWICSFLYQSMYPMWRISVSIHVPYRTPRLLNFPLRISSRLDISSGVLVLRA